MMHSAPSVVVQQWSIVVFIAGLLMGSVPMAQADTTSGDIPDVVATVKGEPIAAQELLTAVKGELLRLEMERYDVLRKKLNELIAQHIMRLEADHRGISLAQLEQEEIVAKTPPITPEQVKQFYDANQAQIRHPFDRIEGRLTAYMQQEAQRKRQQELFQELLQRYPVKIALSPPKVQVAVDDDPVKGPAEAPVTIVEFSDFQCPYCRRVQPVLTRLLEEYPDKVKLVFRDFPLRNIHPQAQKAAEAAQCAADQQHFWPYHDKLFASTDLQVDDLKQYAEELELDSEQFAACLDSGKYASEVDNDLKDGLQVGVSSTPTFFINGVLLSGAAPYERFKELVDEALARTTQA